MAPFEREWAGSDPRRSPNHHRPPSGHRPALGRERSAARLPSLTGGRGRGARSPSDRPAHRHGSARTAPGLASVRWRPVWASARRGRLRLVAGGACGPGRPAVGDRRTRGRGHPPPAAPPSWPAPEPPERPRRYPVGDVRSVRQAPARVTDFTGPPLVRLRPPASRTSRAVVLATPSPLRPPGRERHRPRRHPSDRRRLR